MRALLTGLALIFIFLPSAAATKPPSWDKVIPGSKRFKVLDAFDGRAVLDRETGLVWTKAAVGPGLEASWALAKGFCLGQLVGPRLGFRLPTVYELTSLFEAQGFPRNHPFEGLDTRPLGSVYWSATESWFNSNDAVGVAFSSGAFIVRNKTDALPFLCVRGGSDPSGQ